MVRRVIIMSLALGFAILSLIVAPTSPVRAAAAQYIPILTYHHVDDHVGRWYVAPLKFGQELSYIASNGYSTISMESYMDAFQFGKTLAGKPIVLSFDDGYEDAYTNVFPALKKFGMTGTFFIVTGFVGQPGYLTWDQIAEMEQAGMEFGAHTVHHAYLTMIPRPRAFLEIWLSKVILSLHLGKSVDIFAYPYNDHNAAIIQMAQQAGFRGACIVTPHKGDKQGNMFEIERVGILSGESTNIFDLVLAVNVNAPRTSTPKAKVAPKSP